MTFRPVDRFIPAREERYDTVYGRRDGCLVETEMSLLLMYDGHAHQGKNKIQDRNGHISQKWVRLDRG